MWVVAEKGNSKDNSSKAVSEQLYSIRSHIFQVLYLSIGDIPCHALQTSQVYCCLHSVASIPKGYMPDRGRNVQE